MGEACASVAVAKNKWTGDAMAARLKERYVREILPQLMKEMGYTNPLQVPRLDKIVLNVGLGEAIQNAKALDVTVGELTAISGQKPVVTKARKAIANFKLREGMPIGCMVTLRGERMYEFFDRLVNVALPRVRDFKGVSDRSFDGRGNYALGVREQIIFPEIDLDKLEKVRGLTVCINTTAKSDAEGKALLRAMGMPFRS
jgi:large subunit ribosomal protein L5